MAIDFLINRPCKPKEELGDQAIVHLVKSRHRAEALLKRFMDQGMKREEALASQFGFQTMKPDGVSEIAMVTVGSLLKQAELLDDHRHHCQGCQANLGSDFGCFQSINYPISEVAEEWLAKMAAKAISTGMPNSILVKFMLDQNVQGEAFSKMRNLNNNSYLQAEFPIEIEGENDEGQPFVIDTNQIMEMFFAVGEMADVHQQFLLFFSGGLTVQDNAPDPSKIGIEYQAAMLQRLHGAPRYWVYRMPDSLNDDRTVRQIKVFLRAVFAAQTMNTTLWVDF
jgi:hypothetical protein